MVGVFLDVRTRPGAMVPTRDIKYKGSGVVNVLFLESREDDVWMNRLTAALGGWVHGKPGFCHVEICFPDHRQGFMSSSIYQNETVTLTSSKTFANPGYVIQSLAVSAEELQAIRGFVEASHTDGVRFDGVGMMLASLPLHWYGCPKNKTFCSRYVTEALQAAKIGCVQGVNAGTVTPTRLHKLLRREMESRGVVGSVGHKQAAMQSRAGDSLSGLIPTLGLGTCRGGKYERLG